ncbi:unnamed protein product [Linum tenue]|uniref:Uncharacterized protein n=1 Tax=Linum tenue TaxID=586396 RepID=A0AAV0RHB5_9ROSI|nr:unnamed protein product [Linum tenue]
MELQRESLLLISQSKLPTCLRKFKGGGLVLLGLLLLVTVGRRWRKEDLPEDTQEICRDPTFTLYHTNHIPDSVVPVLLVAGSS